MSSRSTLEGGVAAGAADSDSPRIDEWGEADENPQKKRPLARQTSPLPEEIKETGIDNPFVNLTRKLTTWDYIRYIFPGSILLVIRFAIALLAVGCVGVLAGIATIGHDIKDVITDDWRLAVLWPVPFFERVLLWSFGYWWISIRGKLAPRSAAPIAVGNHTSFVDPIMMHMLTGGSPVARAESRKVPVIGAIMTAIQTIWVDRTGSAEARHAVADCIRDRARDNRAPRVMLFPEATCTNGRAVITFKTGAFRPMVPVQPVVIRYPHQYCDPSWVYAGPGGNAIMFRLMAQIYNLMEVVILDPIDPKDYDAKTPAEFARVVQGVIADELGVPATRHSFTDIKLQAVAHKAHYPVEHMSQAEGAALMEVTDMDVDAAGAVIRRFIAADRDRDGQVNLLEFMDAFTGHLPASLDDDARRRHKRFLRNLFNHIDHDASGSLSFREFFVGLAIINAQSDKTRNSALKLAFRTITNDADYITHPQLVEILRFAYPEMDAEAVAERFEAAQGGNRLTEAEFIAWASEHEDMFVDVRQALLGRPADAPEPAKGKKAKATAKVTPAAAAVAAAAAEPVPPSDIDMPSNAPTATDKGAASLRHRPSSDEA